MSKRDDRVYLDELAELVGRAPHSVRQVLREGVLPAALQPEREGGRRTLVWRRGQVPGLKKFFKQRLKRRGWQHS